MKLQLNYKKKVHSQKIYIFSVIPTYVKLQAKGGVH